MAIVPISEPEKQLTLGISACLLGDKVRYNGDHKRSSFCANTLERFFHFEAVCPEVAIGLGIPREPIRLVGHQDQVSGITDIRVLGVKDTSFDVTDQLKAYGEQKVTKLSHISGYILMQKSPSCGMERVKVYHENGYPLGQSAAGAYAAVLKERMPLLPIEEDGRLHDPILCDNFFCRVYAYGDWQRTVQINPSYQGLVQFHSRYKYMVMAHSPSDYVNTGRIVAQGSNVALDELLAQYISALMQVLTKRANRKSHTNAMMHVIGYVKTAINSDEKQHFLTLVEQYRQGMVPLIVPMAQLRNLIDMYGNDYIKQQTYLRPYPDQLGLRNHI